MKLAHHLPHPARRRRGAASLAALVALLSTGLLLPLSLAHAATAVPLGTAESFAVLAGSTISNTGPSTVTGDVGLHPGTAVTGFDDGADAVTHEGTRHETDGVALQAKTDLDTAYTNAAGQTPVTEIPTELGETTLTAGVYDSAAGTFGVTGALTLDGEGDPDAVFIFQMGSTLTTASASSVNVINGADLCNVYWQVGSSATLGTDSTFRGTIMADQSISLTTGAMVEGRVLARVGAVTMDTNTITNSACTTPAGEDDDTTDDDGTTGGDDTTDDDGTTDGEATTDGEDTTDGEGTTDGDDTTGGEDTTDGEDTTGGDTTTDGGTTSQIQRVPGGAVAAGGGDVDAVTSTLPMLPVGVLILLMVGGALGVAARRRVRV